MFQLENGSARIEAFGKPAEVVKTVDIPDVGAPAAGEVVNTFQHHRGRSATPFG
jgi:hypothetical protein